MEELSKPFSPNELSWRVQMATKKGNSYRILIVPYITSRNVLCRLDEVCGGFWQSNFDTITINSIEAFQCRLSIKFNDEWVTRTDGSEISDIESIKGGHSNALKRAAAQWGIGRYIYDLKNIWVDVQPKGNHYFNGQFRINGEIHKIKGYYNIPSLPDWAVPNGVNSHSAASKQQTSNSKEQAINNSTVTASQANDFKLEYAAMVKEALTYLKVPDVYIQPLFRKALGTKKSLNEASQEELKDFYKVLFPVYKYVKECSKFKIPEHNMTYYAQIVLKVEIKNIFSLFLKMDEAKCDKAIKLLIADIQHHAG